jgi:hypothetical protein
MVVTVDLGRTTDGECDQLMPCNSLGEVVAVVAVDDLGGRTAAVDEREQQGLTDAILCGGGGNMSVGGGCISLGEAGAVMAVDLGGRTAVGEH